MSDPAELQGVPFPATVIGSAGRHYYGDAVSARADGWRSKWPSDGPRFAAELSAEDAALLSRVEVDVRRAVESALGELLNPRTLSALVSEVARTLQLVDGVAGLSPPREVGAVAGGNRCHIIFRESTARGRAWR